MLLYRSIGTREFNALLSNKIIEGKYNLSKEKQSSFDEEGLYVCFFEDEYWWLDSRHKVCVNVDIPEEELKEGIGVYYASKNMAKTHIWSGRSGNECYKLKERYAKSYSLNNVVAISLPNYTESALKQYKEIIKQKGIKIIDNPKVVLEEKKFKNNLSIKFHQYANCKKNDWHKSLKEFLKQICNKNEYNGIIDIDCYDNSNFFYFNPNEDFIVTFVTLDLTKNDKNLFVTLNLKYSLDTKNYLLEKCKKNEEYDLSRVVFINRNNKQFLEKGTLENLESSLQSFFE